MNRNALMKVFTLVDKKLQLDNLYGEIFTLENEYPNFEHWYFEKVIPETLEGKRKVYTASIGENHAGVLILKPAESKICTLRVSSVFQHLGIGKEFLKISFQELGTNKPFITVSDLHYKEFQPLFLRYSFAVSELHINKYVNGHYEVALNGHLE